MIVALITTTFFIKINAVSQEQKHFIESGITIQGGYPPEYITRFSVGSAQLITPYKLDIFQAGFYVGLTTRRIDNLSYFKGRGEVLSEIYPFWLAHYPAQTYQVIYKLNNQPPQTIDSSHWKGENIPGVSVTPVILRWNFSHRDEQRLKPWLQMGCGVLWTDHKFPLSYISDTSVFNVTPQVGAGVDVFRNPRHSVNLGFKFIHISNGGLGDHNPAIHDSLNFSLGYSWWR